MWYWLNRNSHEDQINKFAICGNIFNIPFIAFLQIGQTGLTSNKRFADVQQNHCEQYHREKEQSFQFYGINKHDNVRNHPHFVGISW